GVSPVDPTSNACHYSAYLFMTPKGAKLIGAICAALILGAVWFQFARARVADEIKNAAEKQTTDLADLRKSNRNLQEAIRVARNAVTGPGVDLPATTLMPELPPDASRA